MFLKINAIIKISFLGAVLLLTSCGGGSDSGGGLPAEDTTPPIVASKTPDNLIIDVNIIEPIIVSFDENISAVTENNVALFKYQSTTPNDFDEILQATDRVKVTASVVDNILTIIPTLGVMNGFVEYTNSARYKLTLIGIQDKAGNSLANTTWEFATTTKPSGTIQPTMNEIVSAATDIIISFDEEMNIQSLKDAFTLVELGATVTPITNWTVDFDTSNNIATYTVPTNLNVNSSYKVSLSTQATDTKGNGIEANISSTFSTNTVTTSTVLDTKPKNVIATASTQGIDIQWEAAPAIAGNSQAITYNLYVSTDDIIYTSIVKNISALTYSDNTGINNNVPYRYAVTANAGGKESYKVFSKQVIPVEINNPGKFTFEFLKSEVSETAGVIKLKVLRSGGSSGEVSVNFETVIGSGTATANLDYVAVVSIPPASLPKIIFPDKSKEQFIDITIINDTEFNEALLETFSISLSNPSNGASIDTTGNRHLHQVTIVNEDILSVDFGIKQLKFSWLKQPDATISYKLLENANGAGFKEVGQTVNEVPSVDGTSLTKTIDISIYDYDWINSRYLLEVCNIVNICIRTNEVTTANQALNTIGYFKASNTGLMDRFGYSIALSGDGKTLAIGATGEERKDGVIINSGSGTPFPIRAGNNDVGASNGAVYVFTRNDITGQWAQQAYIKPSDQTVSHYFGVSIAVSNDGITLAVGDTANGGVVHLFIRDVSTGNWARQAQIKPVLIVGENSPFFGQTLALSGDGKMLAVGDPKYIIYPGGVGKTIGKVYLYNFLAGKWVNKTQITATNKDADDFFGSSIALSYYGEILAIGARGEASTQLSGVTNTAFFPDSTTDKVAADFTGAVWTYYLDRTNNYMIQAYFKASNASTGDNFGASVSLSNDGRTMAVGAWGEASNQAITNTGGSPGTETIVADSTGAVYLFNNPSTTSSRWEQKAYIKALNGEAADYFGISVALSGNGQKLAVAASGERSNLSSVINTSGFPTVAADNDSAVDTGAVYMFAKLAGSWAQTSYIKASNPDSGDFFGFSIALSGSGKKLPDGRFDNDGSTLAVGGYGENSISTDVKNSNITPDMNNLESNTGAVYLY